MTPLTGSGIVVRTWNDAPISRRDDDGYADATAMCQANGKRWPDYQRLDQTSSYLQALVDATGLAPEQLVISTTTGPNHLRGTWIHPRLAVDLARWISPAFAVWMDGWFLDAVSTKQPRQLRRTRSRTFSAICACCGEAFNASSSAAIYCHVNCRRRAGYYRRQGRLIPQRKSRPTQPISLALTAAPVASLAPAIKAAPTITITAPNRHAAATHWRNIVEQEAAHCIRRELRPYGTESDHDHLNCMALHSRVWSYQPS